jgi:hypothetical protein
MGKLKAKIQNARQYEAVISTLPSAMPVCGGAGFFGSRYRSLIPPSGGPPSGHVAFAVDSKPPHGFSPFGYVAAPVQTAYKPSAVLSICRWPSSLRFGSLLGSAFNFQFFFLRFSSKCASAPSCNFNFQLSHFSFSSAVL